MAALTYIGVQISGAFVLAQIIRATLGLLLSKGISHER